MDHFFVAAVQEQVGEIIDALDHLGVADFLVIEGVSEPLGDVAGGFQAAGGGAFVAAPFEPVGAEAAVGILQTERVGVVVIDKLSCARSHCPSIGSFRCWRLWMA